MVIMRDDELGDGRLVAAYEQVAHRVDPGYIDFDYEMWDDFDDWFAVVAYSARERLWLWGTASSVAEELCEIGSETLWEVLTDEPTDKTVQATLKAWEELSGDAVATYGEMVYVFNRIHD